MIRLRPLTSRLRWHLAPGPIFARAARTVEIAARQTIELPQLLHLPDEIDRIIAHHPVSNPQRNITMLKERQFDQGPCRIHLLHDAVIADGSILIAASFARVRTEPSRWMLRGEMPEIDEALFASTFVSERYFAHWLLDQLSAELLSEDQQLTPLALAGNSRPNEPGYRDILAMHPARVTQARVKRLWWPEDWDYTDNRFARIERMRARLADKVEPGPDRRVYIARGQLAVGRNLVNEASVCEALANDGFTIIEPEQMAPLEITRALRGAQIVVGAEGSAFSHAVLAAPAGARFVQIMGPRDFNLNSRLRCAGLGFTLCITIADDLGPGQSTMPIARLKRAIDLAGAAV
ncbi:MAG: glycosyltransferase family 61 protein [Proteobacteria bacterium]|nr:glycosyltransferase family 61 protein [Pseudomonadota bacterium]